MSITLGELAIAQSFIQPRFLHNLARERRSQTPVISGCRSKTTIPVSMSFVKLFTFVVKYTGCLGQARYPKDRDERRHCDDSRRDRSVGGVDRSNLIKLTYSGAYVSRIFTRPLSNELLINARTHRPDVYERPRVSPPRRSSEQRLFISPPRLPPRR